MSWSRFWFLALCSSFGIMVFDTVKTPEFTITFFVSGACSAIFLALWSKSNDL